MANQDTTDRSRQEMVNFNISPNKDILLVSMPLVCMSNPSIQLGILYTKLTQASINASSLSAYAIYGDYLLSHNLVDSVNDYNQNISNSWVNEWIFTSHHFKGNSPRSEEYIKRWHNKKRFQKLSQIRTATCGFIESLADQIVDASPKIIAFSTTFQQNIASLAVSKLVKQINPKLKVLFGGAACDGGRGEALITEFPWIDVVLHGDAEPIIVDLVNDMIQDKQLINYTNISYRMQNDNIVLNGKNRCVAKAEEFVVPNYDEYFFTINKLASGKEIKPIISLPFENSRGCWWGQKGPCKFCALNGELDFRCKSFDKAIGDLQALSVRYQHTKFHCVDNILNHKFYKEYLFQLASSPFDYNLFFEVKSNIGYRELFKLKRAGATSLQPGIESLSSNVLKIMNKGVTAIQNIRFLKACSWLKLPVAWNLLFGFPGETQKDYDEMSLLVKSLYHLQPPTGLQPMVLQRDSHYYNNAEACGIKIEGPAPAYNAMYPLPKNKIGMISSYFEHSFSDGSKSWRTTKQLKKEVDKWQKSKSSLIYSSVGDRIVIFDKRYTEAAAIYKLGTVESLVYRMCFDITSIDEIMQNEQIKKIDISRIELENFCFKLIEERLIYTEGGRLLALAIPVGDPEQILGDPLPPSPEQCNPVSPNL